MAILGVVFGDDKAVAVKANTVVEHQGYCLLFLSDEEYTNVVSKNPTLSLEWDAVHVFLHGTSEHQSSQLKYLNDNQVTLAGEPIPFSHVANEHPFAAFSSILRKDVGWQERIKSLLAEYDMRITWERFELAAVCCAIHAMSPSEDTLDARNDEIEKASSGNRFEYEATDTDKQLLDTLEQAAISSFS